MPPEDTDVEYDAEGGTYRTSYDPECENPSVRLLEAVAAIKGTDPTRLDQLDDYLDPDALDAVFEPTRTHRGTHGSLSFVYEGLLIIVHSDGEIELRDRA